MADNKLYYGDNLAILREYVPDESVDLIYLDPPFNSNRNYNIIFKDESGQSERRADRCVRGHVALGTVRRERLRLSHEHRSARRAGRR